MTITIPTGYYATPDPDQPAESMTYWHIRPDLRGGMKWTAWPPRARYGPRLFRRDVPRDFDGALACKRAFGALLLVWNGKVRAAVEADPAACAVSFANFNGRCFCCSRELSSERWKVLGVGPDCCRKYGLNVSALAAMVTPAIAAAHAVHAAQKAQVAA